MKYSKKILGFILAFVFVISLATSKPIVSEASSYKITISVGDVTNASFDETALSVTSSNAYKTEVKTRSTDDGDVPFKLVISGLGYGDKVSFDAAKLITLDTTKNSKYLVKGVRVAGADKLYNSEDSTNVNINVTTSETYVAAYKICEIIPYKVQYVDTTGAELYQEETLYGAKDEDVVVPARHFNSYKPDVVEKNVKLVDGTVVKFVYTKLDPIEIEEKVTTETTVNYVNGGTKYEYEYEYINGEPTVTTETRPGQNTVTDRGTVHNNRQTTENANGEAAEAGGNEQGAAGADGSTTIDDGQTPTTGGNGEKIEDTKTPKSGEAKEHLGRTLIITMIILIILVITFLVAMHIVNKKRQESFAIPKNKDEE